MFVEDMTRVGQTPSESSLQKMERGSIYVLAAFSMIIAAFVIALSTYWFSSLKSDTALETIAFALAIVSSIIQFKGTVVLLLWGIRAKVKVFLFLSAVGMFGCSILFTVALIVYHGPNKYQTVASPGGTTEQKRSFELAIVCGMNVAFNAAVICLQFTCRSCITKKEIAYNVMA